MIVSCSQCSVKLKVDETKVSEKGSRLKCPKCGNIFTVYPPATAAAAAPAPPPPPPKVEAPPAPPPVMEKMAPPPPPSPPAPPAPPVVKWQLDRRKVVVATDGEAGQNLIKGLLAEAGYEVTTVGEGVSAVMAIEQEKPFLAILDVGLPRIYGFEICDRIKNNGESKDMRVILIASIYDKTRYKRDPVSLYGADDYIEKHHIPECIVQKVRRLATQEPGRNVPREELVCNRQAPETPVREMQAQEMRKDEIKEFPKPSPVDLQQVEAARRFARIILSDIALYNQGAVDEGVRSGNMEELLSAELKEGRELYNSRVSEEIRNSMDYFADELEKFVEKKKLTLGLGG